MKLIVAMADLSLLFFTVNLSLKLINERLGGVEHVSHLLNSHLASFCSISLLKNSVFNNFPVIN